MRINFEKCQMDLNTVTSDYKSYRDDHDSSSSGTIVLVGILAMLVGASIGANLK